MRPAAGLVLALLSTASLSGGFYLQHSASAALPALSPRQPLRSLGSLLASWQWLAGFLTGLAGWGLYIAALSFAPLSLIQATSAGGTGLLALLARLGGNPLPRRDAAAVTAAVAGLVLVGLSLPAGAAHHAQPSWAAPAGWAAASTALAALAAFPAAPALRPGAGLALAAGLLYSAGDVATKAAVDHTSPTWLFVLILLVTHGLAFASLQLAFQRGTALTTAGLATLLTNTLPILAGLIVFAEHLPPGWAGLLRALGFATTTAGAALLAASNRKVTGRSLPPPG